MSNSIISIVQVVVALILLMLLLMLLVFTNVNYQKEIYNEGIKKGIELTEEVQFPE